MLIINYQHISMSLQTMLGSSVYVLEIVFNEVVDKSVLAVIYSDIGQDLQFAHGTCLMIQIDMK